MIGGGFRNVAEGSTSTISGGGRNRAGVFFASGATVGGGTDNTASGPAATIAGGENHSASSDNATVGGGESDTASGPFSTVPGGFANKASGSYSFASGERAKAIHDGTFIWADNSGADFASTAPNQFLIRAAGGVGIGTASPTKKLEVAGSIKTSDTLFASNVSSNSPLRLQAGGTTQIYIDDVTGKVGIGSSTPGRKLDVNGDALVQNSLEISTTTGALIVSRMTTTQRDALTAVNGMIIYNTTTNQFNFRENGAWVTK